MMIILSFQQQSMIGEITKMVNVVVQGAIDGSNYNFTINPAANIFEQEYTDLKPIRIHEVAKAIKFSEEINSKFKEGVITTPCKKGDKLKFHKWSCPRYETYSVIDLQDNDEATDIDKFR
ncbi:hypothetical protein ACTA71_007156 [Dictyostelium dimigraforme]